MLSSVSEMTIKQYYQWLDCYNSDDGLSQPIKMAAFIKGIPYKDAERLNLKDIAIAEAQFNSIDQNLEERAPSGIIKVGDKKFKVTIGTDAMVSAQYIDFCQVRDAYRDNQTKGWHALLAVCCYENEYDGIKNKEKEDLFLNHCKMKDAYPIAFFLSARLKMLNEIILPYLAEHYPKIMMKEIISDSVGGGSFSWKGFVKRITRTWTRFYASLWLSFLIGGLILKRVMIYPLNKLRRKIGV